MRMTTPRNWLYVASLHWMEKSATFTHNNRGRVRTVQQQAAGKRGQTRYSVPAMFWHTKYLRIIADTPGYLTTKRWDFFNKNWSLRKAGSVSAIHKKHGKQCQFPELASCAFACCLQLGWITKYSPVNSKKTQNEKTLRTHCTAHEAQSLANRNTGFGSELEQGKRQ